MRKNLFASMLATFLFQCSDLVQSYFPELVAMLTQNDLEVCTVSLPTYIIRR